jgi:hypothetical protein
MLLAVCCIFSQLCAFFIKSHTYLTKKLPARQSIKKVGVLTLTGELRCFLWFETLPHETTHTSKTQRAIDVWVSCHAQCFVGGINVAQRLALNSDHF